MSMRQRLYRTGQTPESLALRVRLTSRGRASDDSDGGDAAAVDRTFGWRQRVVGPPCIAEACTAWVGDPRTSKVESDHRAEGVRAVAAAALAAAEDWLGHTRCSTAAVLFTRVRPSELLVFAAVDLDRAGIAGMLEHLQNIVALGKPPADSEAGALLRQTAEASIRKLASLGPLCHVERLCRIAWFAGGLLAVEPGFSEPLADASLPARAEAALLPETFAVILGEPEHDSDGFFLSTSAVSAVIAHGSQRLQSFSFRSPRGSSFSFVLENLNEVTEQADFDSLLESRVSSERERALLAHPLMRRSAFPRPTAPLSSPTIVSIEIHEGCGFHAGSSFRVVFTLATARGEELARSRSPWCSSAGLRSRAAASALLGRPAAFHHNTLPLSAPLVPLISPPLGFLTHGTALGVGMAGGWVVGSRSPLATIVRCWSVACYLATLLLAMALGPSQAPALWVLFALLTMFLLRGSEPQGLPIVESAHADSVGSGPPTASVLGPVGETTLFHAPPLMLALPAEFGERLWLQVQLQQRTSGPAVIPVTAALGTAVLDIAQAGSEDVLVAMWTPLTQALPPLLPRREQLEVLLRKTLFGSGALLRNMAHPLLTSTAQRTRMATRSAGHVLARVNVLRPGHR